MQKRHSAGVCSSAAGSGLSINYVEDMCSTSQKDLRYGIFLCQHRQTGQRNGTDTIWSCHVTTSVLETGLESCTEVEPMSRITSIPPTSTTSRRLQILPERSEASTAAFIPSIPVCPLEINLEHLWISSPVWFMIHDFATELYLTGVWFMQHVIGVVRRISVHFVSEAPLVPFKTAVSISGSKGMDAHLRTKR